jgi:ribonuclease P protein component
MNQRFGPHERVKLQRDFDRLFKEGRALRYPEFTLRVLPGETGQARLGLSVGKRVGNSVRRSRIKRLLREAFRRNKGLLTCPCDLVIVPSTRWQELRLPAVEPTMQRALQEVSRLFAAVPKSPAAGGEPRPCDPI